MLHVTLMSSVWPKDFGGKGMEGMAMGWDGSRGITAMGHDFICVSLVGSKYRLQVNFWMEEYDVKVG